MRDRLLGRLSIGPRGAGILRNGVYALLARACAAGNLFVCMPFVHGSLDPSGFGAWATLASIATIAGLLDFGLSNGAMNLVAAAHARGDNHEVRALAHNAWRILCRTAVILALVALAMLASLSWRNLLGLDVAMGAQAGSAAAVTLASMVVAVPLGLAQRMQLAIGNAMIGYRFAAGGQLLACIATILLARLGAGLPVLVATTLWPPILMSLCNTLMFTQKLRASTPAVSPGTHKARGMAIQREGLLFFALQLAAMLAYSCDLLLISAMAGAEEAGRYAIVQRLFSLAPLALGLLWTPLWPAYRQALARGEFAWAFRTLRRSMSVAICGAVAIAAVCWHWFDAISGTWMRTSISPQPQLLAGMAAWAVADAAGGAYVTLLNAAGTFRFLLTTGCLFSVATLGSKAWLVAHGHVALLPWASLACFMIFELIPLLALWPRLARDIRTRSY